jgi:hypothetical protein
MPHARFEGFSNGALLVLLVLPGAEAKCWNGSTSIELEGSHLVWALKLDVYGT